MTNVTPTMVRTGYDRQNRTSVRAVLKHRRNKAVRRESKTLTR